MNDLQQPLPSNSLPPSVAAIETAQYDDVALGCECANPALQIERWSLEAPPAWPSH